MTRVVYIAACAHSGSTLLERLICGGPGAAAIGEVFQLIDPRNRSIYHLDGQLCACGQPIGGCPFWSGLLPRLTELHGNSPEAAYGEAVEYASRHLGRPNWVVDSSKTIRGLQTAWRSQGERLMVIHLARDVRAWLVSQFQAQRRQQEQTLAQHIRKRGWKGPWKYLGRNRFAQFASWHRFNRQVTEFCRQESIERLPLTYEALCFRPEAALGRIAEFIGCERLSPDTMDRQANNHNVFGNRMRLKQADHLIRYDDRWLHEKCWLWPALLLPQVTRFNRRFAERSEPSE